MTAYFSLLVAILGLFTYALAANPKAAEIGRIAYFAGLFVFLLQFAPHLVNVLK